jgi:hypothetical protein
MTRIRHNDKRDIAGILYSSYVPSIEMPFFVRDVLQETISFDMLEKQTATNLHQIRPVDLNCVQVILCSNVIAKVILISTNPWSTYDSHKC